MGKPTRYENDGRWREANGYDDSRVRMEFQCLSLCLDRLGVKETVIDMMMTKTDTAVGDIVCFKKKELTMVSLSTVLISLGGSRY